MAKTQEARILEKIQRLLNMANDSAASPAEREQFLDEANRQMARHAIDQAMLDVSRTSAEKRKPVKRHIQLFDENFEWGTYFYSVIMAIAETNRCKAAWHGDAITVVGMQEDVDWVEMLWLNTFMQFSAKIKPTWDLNLSVEENIYNFKNAGFKWKDIWEIGYFKLPDGMPDGNGHFIPNKCKYMINGYKKMCKDKGTEPIGTQSFAAYKLTFTSYFTWEVKKRLEAMRESNKEQEEATPGSAVALFDTSKLIEEEFYLIFPMLSPEAREKSKALQLKEKEDAEKRDAAFLASLSPQARKTELERRLKAEAAQARADAAYFRKAGSRRTYDAAGANAGRVAGQGVDLSRRSAAAPSGSKTELPG